MFVEEKGLLERAQTARKLDDLPFGRGEQVELAVTLEIGLFTKADAFKPEFRRELTWKGYEFPQVGFCFLF